MTMEAKYILPDPVLDEKEQESLDKLTERYNKITSASIISKMGRKVANVMPDPVKNMTAGVKESLAAQKIYNQSMELIGKSFQKIETYASKFSVSEDTIVKKVNQTVEENEITSLEEICLARSYDLSKMTVSYKGKNLLMAMVEGKTTGLGGLAGLPFNIVLSTFLYFRAVQSVAMIYGYDAKNDPAELILASNVFMNALSPGNTNASEIGSIVGKIMVMGRVEIVKQTAQKTWVDMASRGGMELLLVQVRALAHKSAQRALEQAGAKGLENSIFRKVFELLGKKLTLKTIQRAVPFISSYIAGFIDTAQMGIVLEYADVFYNKRYIVEKEARVHELVYKDRTIGYYNDNAEDFIKNTVNVDFSGTQDRFLEKLKQGDRILDLGCGSGRDTKYFLEKGFEVDAVDGSEAMCRYAGELTGIDVKQMKFQELDAEEEYDGIWACSSLLHLKKAELRDVLIKAVTALKKDGILYTSFKDGDFEGERNERYFTDFTEDTFREFMKDIGSVEIEEIWTAPDARPERTDQKWLNLILRKI